MRQQISVLHHEIHSVGEAKFHRGRHLKLIVAFRNCFANAPTGQYKTCWPNTNQTLQSRTGAKALYLTVSTVKSTWRRWYVNEICNTDHGWGDNDKTFVLGVNRGSLSRMSTTNPTRTGSWQIHDMAFSAGKNTGCPSPLTIYILWKAKIRKNNTITFSS